MSLWKSFRRRLAEKLAELHDDLCLCGDPQDRRTPAPTPRRWT